MLSTDYVIYLNHEGREYQAQLMALDADNSATLMVYGGENGAWTVEQVPHVSNPERPTPGACWEGAIPERTDDPTPPTLDADEPDVPTQELAPVEQTPKKKRANSAERKPA